MYWYINVYRLKLHNHKNMTIYIVLRRVKFLLPVSKTMLKLLCSLT